MTAEVIDYVSSNTRVFFRFVAMKGKSVLCWLSDHKDSDDENFTIVSYKNRTLEVDLNNQNIQVYSDFIEDVYSILVYFYNKKLNKFIEPKSISLKNSHGVEKVFDIYYLPNIIFIERH